MLLAVPAMLSACQGDLTQAYRELDHVIDNRPSHRGRFEEEAEKIKNQLDSSTDDDQRWDASLKLFELYRYFQADSAQVYLTIAQQYAEKRKERINLLVFYKAEFYTTLRQYDEAKEILSGICIDSLSSSDKAMYYKTDLYLDGTMALDELISSDERERIMAVRHEKRYKYINCDGIDHFEKVRRTGMQMYESGNAQEGVKILAKLVDETTDLREKAAAEYSLAYAYQYLGNRELRKYWLAKSAAISLQIPVRDYYSLYELSNMLFEDDETSRASRYCQIALDDALECKFNTRIINSTLSQLEIVRAVERKTRIDTIVVVLTILGLSILLVIIFFLWRDSAKQHEKIKIINKQLSDTNKIKEGYVFRYITLSANYLKKVEKYRHEMRVALKEGGVDALKAMLRSPADAEIDYKSFYRIFDETFIGLFPDFVDKVNGLMKPEARFTLKKGHELSTELRILAAIKLGFTDSGNIAEFLNCAPSSVYTYRSKLKKDSVCGPEKFEENILKI